MDSGRVSQGQIKSINCLAGVSGGLLQRSVIDLSPVYVLPPMVHEVFRSPGQPLDANTRAFIDRVLGIK